VSVGLFSVSAGLFSVSIGLVSVSKEASMQQGGQCVAHRQRRASNVCRIELRSYRVEIL